MSKKILVTGMSGLIGTLLKNRLAKSHELVALNRSPVEGVKCHQADISKFDDILVAFEGVDTVVHLAAATGGRTWPEYLNTNLIGTYNVFEASRLAHVRRVIYASSGATVTGWEEVEPYKTLVEGRYADIGPSWPKVTHETPTRPSDIYGCSKVWGEALARQYSDQHGMSAICLRIGRVTPQDRPVDPRTFSVFCSQRDVTNLLELCINAPDRVRFDIFYAVSDNKWGYRDFDHARQVLGYVPQDAAENFRR